MSDEAREKREADHLWHVWMNRRNFGRPDKSPHEHSLYEFKDMLQFLDYGHVVIQNAFEGKLSKVHRQCSRTAPVEIKENVLLRNQTKKPKRSVIWGALSE